MERSFICLVLVLCSATAKAQESGFKPLSSNPEELYVFKDYLYFTAEDGEHGRELWRISVPDGLPELIKDATPGAEGSELDHFYGFNDTLYFRRKDPVYGGELWSSDGIPGGKTERIKRFNDVPSDGGFFSVLGHVGDTVLLGVGTDIGSRSVWRTDGTTEGTTDFFERSTGSFQSTTQLGMQWGEKLLLGASGNSNDKSNSGLCITDGTMEGTTYLTQMDKGIALITRLGEKGILFTGKTEELGQELWFTAGTPETTRLLKDIYPGPDSSDVADGVCYYDPLGNREPIAYFRAINPVSGAELWQSDGTPEGTRLAFDIAPGTASSSPYQLSTSSDGIFFNANTKETGTELFFLSLSGEPSYALVKDIKPGFRSSDPYAHLVPGGGGALYFSADGTLGEEFWVSSGTEDTTQMLVDMVEGPGSSFPNYTTAIGSYIVFAATHPIYGRELWYTSKKDSVHLLCDIYADHSENPSSSPTWLTPLGDRLLFVADDVAHGRELWATEGADGDAELVMDIYPGRIGSQPEELTVVGDLVYFAADAPETGTELYVSDGTPTGTSMVQDICPNELSSGPKHLFAWRGILLFSAFRPYDGEELWAVWPGRKVAIVANIRPGSESSLPSNFVAWKEHVYFQANDGTKGAELWRTDGTREGTTLVEDVVPVPYEKLSVTSMVPLHNRLFLSAHTETFGHELWSIDEEGKGFSLVDDIATRAHTRIFKKHSK